MTVCLSMIVKNESHVIVRCLESIKSYIDYWIICDTGSTDNTIDLIKETLKNIPGEIHQNEWINFSTNRNIALELSKTKADYILFMDADDYLIVSDKLWNKKLKFPAYGIKINQNTISYERTCLISSKIPSKYQGVLHEYIELPVNITAILLQEVQIQFGGDGNRSKDPQKYVKDAEIFERALLDDPTNSRYVFYCAQSWRDACNLHKACEFYAKRIIMGGWAEEAGYAALELGKLLEKINSNDTANILTAYNKSYNLAPHRVEPLVFISTYLRKLKLFDMAYFYSKIGTRILMPKSGLFIQNDCYEWRIKDEFAVAAYYIGQYKEAYNMNMEILNNKTLPLDDKNRIIQNLDFCKAKI